jgi:hypothetical protein
MLVLCTVFLLAGVVLAVLAGHDHGGTAKALISLCVLCFIAGSVMLFGLTAVAPGQARVVQLFGKYRGTIRESGLQWVNPFTDRIKVSTRIRNQESRGPDGTDRRRWRRRRPGRGPARLAVRRRAGPGPGRSAPRRGRSRAPDPAADQSA